MPGVFDQLDDDEDLDNGQEHEDQYEDGGAPTDYEENEGQEGAADQDDDEGEGQEEADRQPDRDVGRRPQGRRDRRIETLTKRSREQERELERYRQQEFERERQQRMAPQETPEQREQRYAAMDPMERMETRHREDMGRFQQDLAQERFNNADRADRSDFRSSTPRKLLDQYGDQVERMLAGARQQGTNYDRATILKFIIGEEIMKKSGQNDGKARRAAQDRVQRQTTRPVSSRSDRTNGDGRRGQSEREARVKRLENLQL